MSMFSLTACVFALALVLQSWALETVETAASHHHKGKHHHHKGKHHHKGHHHHGKHHNASAAKAEHHDEKAAAAAVGPTAPVKVAKVTAAVVPVPKAAVQLSRDQQLVAKMKVLEARLAQKKKAQVATAESGHILVMGPLPADFPHRFSKAVASATGVDAKSVMVVKTGPVAGQDGVVSVDFRASKKVVSDVEGQVADPDSKLASGNLHSFLVAKGDEDDEEKEDEKEEKAEKKESKKRTIRAKKPLKAASEDGEEATPVEEKGIDIDTAMPYGDLEPFGREDTAQELTESSVQESDSMVDQLERAEVAEEKRAVFRALTRLRGAAITSFDGVARSQTGNIDEYNKIHKWRNSHPLHHLADEESDISKWAFPDNADF